MSWKETYKSRLKQLSTPSLYGEVLRLENSIKHLRRSNQELRDHESSTNEDTSWIAPVISENEQVIAKQSEQVELVKSEFSDRGTVSDHADDSANPIPNGNREEVMDDNAQDVDRMEVDESSDGLHL
jgi:hypothetical protein